MLGKVTLGLQVVTVIKLSGFIILSSGPKLNLSGYLKSRLNPSFCPAFQIDTWCKENRYVIAGYYQANERTKDSR